MAAGEAAYEAGDYVRAKAIFLSLSEKGHAKAENMIGLMYSKVKGFEKDRVQACDWYERAAERGYVSAQLNLSICYFQGSGRPQNNKFALKWSLKAAEQDNKNAQASLAAYFLHRDRKKYLYWAQKAAANGSVKAKALMWANGEGILVPDLTAIDLVCFVVMVGWLDKPDDYCD
ncbi:tetratricopeptide repeat protein [Magnetovibrio blakemorei]|nr:tetratricopeptide repeat protein [Magnetovibrio blakemorei]